MDVYTLIDSDTDEARAFTTYRGYWMALAEHVESGYGDPPFAVLLAELEARGLRRLGGRPCRGDGQLVQSALLNAWSSELALYLVDLDNSERLWLANQWGQVKSYYATTRAASAWLVAREGQAPTTHAGLLRAIAAQITGSQLYPCPWSLCCSALLPQPVYVGFTSPPEAISSLQTSADPYDRCAMMLRTTRDRDVRKHVEIEKQKLRRRRAPNGEFARQDARLPATTVFDFAWRTRTRSNYGDPAMFYVGTLTPERSREYASAIRAFTSATMFLFEAMIAQRARKTLIDSAVHFMSRDRSRLAEDVMVPRLKTLGLL